MKFVKQQKKNELGKTSTTNGEWYEVFNLMRKPARQSKEPLYRKSEICNNIPCERTEAVNSENS